MANTNTPTGARPYGQCTSLRRYKAAAATYPGDFVKLTSDGNVTVATATDACVGVAMTYATAAGQDVLVADDADQNFIIQADGTAISAQTALNLNYEILATAANTTYKQSRMELNSATGATTATLPLKLLDILGTVNKAAFGEAVDCVVCINNHQRKGGTGTLGT